MEAVSFRGVKAVLGPPDNWDEAVMGPCGSLPVGFCEQGIISVWKPSAEDLERLNAGGGVMLVVASRSMPPVYMETVPQSTLTLPLSS